MTGIEMGKKLSRISISDNPLKIKGKSLLKSVYVSFGGPIPWTSVYTSAFGIPLEKCL